MAVSNNIAELDLRNYVGPARVSARHVQHVGRAMEAALPPDATAEERAAIGEVVTAAEAVQAQLIERERFAPARVRPLLFAFGTAWSILGDVLGALARHGDLSPRTARAAALHASLLPEGTTFVKDDAGAAWAAGERVLSRIDAEGLAPALVELVGEDVLDAARSATRKLREAAGAGPAPREAASTPSVSEAVAVFTDVLGFYSRLLSSKVRMRDARSIDRFRKAVAPLDEYRANVRSSGADDDDADELRAPAPAVPIPPGMPGASPFITGS